jgi:DNA-directed RNA polymerase specialized sigma subunit
MSERSDLSDQELEDLLRLLKEESEDIDAVREEILGRGTPIIGEVIGATFSTSGFTTEELFRPGYLGLLNAVYNYDLSRGRSFREYAENLIKGEIRNHIRDRVGQVVIPDWMRDLNRQIEAAEARLLRETGRLPSLGELAEAVNITEEGLTEIFKAREALSYVSLDASQRENDPIPTIDLSKIRSKRPSAFPIEHRIKLASALEKLADLQQYLLHSLFRADE